MAHLESGDADARDLSAFEDWRDADPAHAVAIERLGGLGTQLRNRTEVERATLRRLFLRPRRRLGGSALAIAVLVGVGWAASRLPALQLYFADERTAAGEMRAVNLADGSRLLLASESAVDLDVGGKRRTVRLLRGELLAEVAKGQPVRFKVETSDGSAEALGTAFTVRMTASATVIAVASSQVRACPSEPADPADCLTLAPGERASIGDGVVARLTNVPVGDVAAWTEGWLPADERPLVDVLDELNRWRARPIRFDRDALSGLRVSGILPLRDSDRALANLARSQPITVDRSDPASPIVRRDPK